MDQTTNNLHIRKDREVYKKGYDFLSVVLSSNSTTAWFTATEEYLEEVFKNKSMTYKDMTNSGVAFKGEDIKDILKCKHTNIQLDIPLKGSPLQKSYITTRLMISKERLRNAVKNKNFRVVGYMDIIIPSGGNICIPLTCSVDDNGKKFIGLSANDVFTISNDEEKIENFINKYKDGIPDFVPGTNISFSDIRRYCLVAMLTVTSSKKWISSKDNHGLMMYNQPSLNESPDDDPDIDDYSSKIVGDVPEEELKGLYKTLKAAGINMDDIEKISIMSPFAEDANNQESDTHESNLDEFFELVKNL